jgi:hypothetical protein
VFSEDVYLTLSAIKKKTGLSYGVVTEKLLRSATDSKSIKSVIETVFPEEPVTQK